MCLVCVEMLASSEFFYNDTGLPPVPKSKCIGGVNNQRVGALCRNGTDVFKSASSEFPYIDAGLPPAHRRCIMCQQRRTMLIPHLIPPPNGV